MSRIVNAAKAILSHIETFSRLALRMPLRPYQVPPLTAIIKSILNHEGDEFILIFPRQSGKNEAVAHLLVYLLNLFQRAGGNIVYGAIADGIGRGVSRLEDRLNNDWNRHQWTKANNPLRRLLGRAAVVFLSTWPAAKVRGETAHILLVIDEMQDQNASHIEAVFTPMRADQNATAVYIGTVKFSHDALWTKKSQLERMQRQDGRQRVFIIGPEEVAAANPHYDRFLRNQIANLGRDHPIIQSEYYGRPIDGSGGLFTPQRRAMMRGRHPRQTEPQPGAIYVATLDVAGQDEAATDPVKALANPGRDYTVCTIFEVIFSNRPAPGPTYRAVDVFIDHGGRHFEDAPGQPRLVDRLVAYLEHWNAAHVVADAAGVGEGVTSHLTAELGPHRVTAVKWAGRAKAALGSSFLAVIATGRFAYWSGDEERKLSDGWWFWQQVKACRYELPPEGQFDRDLKWGVPATLKISTPAGTMFVHDDRLLSAAMVSLYDALIKDGTVTLSSGESIIIEPDDPLEKAGEW